MILQNLISRFKGARMFGERRRSITSWGLPLILCALLMRVIVPQGWMPSLDHTGTIKIEMCSGLANHGGAITLDVGGHKSDPSDQHQQDHVCPFAGLSAAFDDARLPTFVAPFAFSDALLPTSLDVVSIGRGLAAPPPPSTGPPTLI